MQNGHPVSAEMSVLIGISRALGTVEGKLDSMDKRMDRQDRILLDTAKQVHNLTGQQTTEKPSRFKRLSDTIRLVWPFLVLAIALVSRIKTGSADWLLPFIEHVKIH